MLLLNRIDIEIKHTYSSVHEWQHVIYFYVHNRYCLCRMTKFLCWIFRCLCLCAYFNYITIWRKITKKKTTKNEKVLWEQLIIYLFCWFRAVVDEVIILLRARVWVVWWYIGLDYKMRLWYAMELSHIYTLKTICL